MHYHPNMLQAKTPVNTGVSSPTTEPICVESETGIQKVTSSAGDEFPSVRSVDGPRFQPFVACSREWSLMLEPNADIAVSEVQVPPPDSGSVLTLESRTGKDLTVDVNIDTHVATFAVAAAAQPHKQWIIRLAPGINKEWTSKPVTLKIQAEDVKQQIMSFDREISQCDLKFFTTDPPSQQPRSKIEGLPKTDF